jgi:septal ring factor EnvC (AmiA/AmiB activator)
VNETVAIGEWISRTLTVGSVGIWTIVIMAAGAWWKGLPAVLGAWDGRLSKQQERIDREFERLERQIKEADDRHDDCMEGQRKLREEMAAVRETHRAEVETLYGQLRQLRQLIASTGANQDMPAGVSPMLAPMMNALSNLPGSNDER